MRTLFSVLTRVVLLSIMAFGVVSGVSAQATIGERIDTYVNAEMQRQKIPGVAVAVMKDGKPMLVKGYGYANVEHQVAVKPETIFQSGSVGKQFTSAAIMLLVEDGKLGLDDKIGKHLSDVPEAWQNITIRHLLSHTGGMTDYPQDFDFRRDYSEDDLLKRAKELPLAFQPGEKWQYSNIGYVTLGTIIRRVSGQFYGDLLRERVFKPLGMATARVISESDIVPNRAAGYRLVNGELKNQNWVSPSLNTTADGALYLSLHDMIKWDDALNNGTLLRARSLDESWTPVKLSNGRPHPYGFGWAVREVNGRRVIEHGGAWQGFKAHIMRVQDAKLSVIVFANLAQANQARIANGIATLIDPGLILKPIADPDPQFTAATNQLFLAVIDKKADMDRFTPELRKAMEASHDRVAAFIKTMGEIQGFQLMSRDERDGVLHYRYKIEYSGMNIFLAMAVDKAGKISGFALQPE